MFFPSKVTEVSFEKLLALLDKHYVKSRSVARQTQGESIREFAVRLRGLSTYCLFETRLEKNLIDIFTIRLLAGKVKEQKYSGPEDNLQ